MTSCFSDAPKSAWQWERGNDELKKVRALLKKD